MSSVETGPDAPNVAEMSFEEALAALEGVVDRLEDGKVPLDASIALYQRGAALRSRCEALLAAAELKVSRIVAGPDGLEAASEPTAPAPGPDARAPAAPKPAAPAADDDIPF